MVAVFLSAIVVYVYWIVDQQKYEYAQRISSAQHTDLRDTSTTHTHTLMTNTKNDRTFLQTLLPTDVVTAVDAIDAVGKAAGVDVHVSTAQPLSASTDARATDVIVVAFTIETRGSFAQISRFVQLLNSLSIPPTYIEQLDFSHTQSSWSLTARIQVFIVSPIAQ